MSDTGLTCYDERRRAAVRASPLNGLDYLEIETFALPDGSTATALMIFFLDKAPEFELANVVITGGLRGRDLHATEVDIYRQPERDRDDCAIVYLDRVGDLSPYTLRLVDLDAHGRPTSAPLPGFDPRYDRLSFSFAATCPSELDCAAPPPGLHPPRPQPEMNYLAKDYASFRRIILDRLALLMPDWRERHTPDIGIALVELLAYVGDELSYYQDAVATEAYLETARRRISVRRHARLVDYQLHEGCNARAWLWLETSADTQLDADEVFFITGYAGEPEAGASLQADDLRGVSASSYEVFEIVLEHESGTFASGDLRDPTALARRIQQQEDPLARYLFRQISVETRALLVQHSETAALSALLETALLGDLNRILSDDGLYDERRFAGVALSVELELSLGLRLRTHECRHANRRLLATAMPEALRQYGRIELYEAHNRIDFYTWGNSECFLARGATAATLRDAWGAGDARTQRALRHLRPGDVLIFAELIGPRTGDPADADPAHRHAVRITHVEPGLDPLNDQPIVAIAWAAEDALPFTLCLSTLGPAPECRQLEAVSVAHGNVVLVDHGRTPMAAVELRDGRRTLYADSIGQVPVAETAAVCAGAEQLAATYIVPGVFAPRIPAGPLVFREPLAPGQPASATLRQEPRRALPQIALYSPAAPRERAPGLLNRPDPQHPQAKRPYRRWSPRYDLLSSGPRDAHFVVEMDDERRANLRFGDGDLGMGLVAGSEFLAHWRIGDAVAGNVGASSITHLVSRGERNGATIIPHQPFSAEGGTPPESLTAVKLMAPGSFRSELRRAIIPEDYATLAMRLFPRQVQRAVARLRWSGMRDEILLLLDARGSNSIPPALLEQVRVALEPYRRIGHDLIVAPARYVPLDIELEVCVKPDYLRGHVRAALLAALSARDLADGRRGFFHPDRLTFGEGIALSALVAAVQVVQGVAYVTVTRLRRRYDGTDVALREGLLALRPDEVARLDNDPIRPENGVLKLTMRGGR
ncbi:hypothetical protein EYB53_021685 [Candidatus Chloroploca sp. M-50]|uniref:Baseplate assembly protein n=1 Tax=Candidatus Chloroploca mongolica TaxID=2528176 RepID=A0ABS4DFX3_9CHLR|nr:putative baseplate assembly protein [Candidatus Chloroploca mongolica]MBP1468338.1 hypothetical protein [Candidatus Chloroploca mongolica]